MKPDTSLDAHPQQRVRQACAELERRLRTGQRCCAEDLLQADALLRNDPELALEVIYTEFVTREELGQEPAADDWYARFPQLRERLHRLFQVHEQLNALELSRASTIDRIALGDGAAGPDTFVLKSQRTIGDYELLGEIGRGGMGVVYRARQLSLNRIVALKMILTGAHASAQDLTRFRAEAEAVARLQHPHIVQIYEVGAHRDDQSDCPYMALEFVAGGSLADLLDRGPLPPRQAAELIATIARAIHFAHDNGIIHRDLKPANVLLSVDPGPSSVAATDHRRLTPKVTDFGLAKRLAEASQTKTGDVVGTPSYMAPEQASGSSKAIGPATDVYGLGAILYELLTGRPPFLAENTQQTMLQVLQEEPVALRRLQARLPRDLETICLKCLRKELRKRYLTANELAADLERFLQGQPITARPVGPTERAVKWARRRPAHAVLIAVAIVAALSLMIGGWWSSVLLRAAAVRETQQRQTAEANYRKALDAVDQMLLEVGAVELADVPQMEAVRERLLHRAMTFYETFLQEHRLDPAVRREAGRACTRLGEIQHLLGDDEEAERTYRRGLDLLHQPTESASASAEHQRNIARTQHALGVLLKANMRLQEAAVHFQQSLALRQKLADQSPDLPEFQRELEETRYQHAALRARLGERQREVEELYEQTLARQLKLTEQFPDRPDYQAELARTHNNLGILLWISDPEAADKSFHEALTLQKKLVERFAAVPGYRWQLARTCNNLGNVQAHLRAPSAARQAYDDARTLLKGLTGDYPRVPSYQQELATVELNRGILCEEASANADAETAIRAAQSLLSQLIADHPGAPVYRFRLAEAQRSLGFLWAKMKRPLEAERACREAVASERSLADCFPEVPEYRSALGGILNSLSQLLIERSEPASLEEARACLLQAVEHQQAALRAFPGNRHYREYLRNDYLLLTTALMRQGDHTRAAVMTAKLPETFPDHVDEYVLAAEFLALCVLAAAEDRKLSETERRDCIERYSRDAVRRLQEAVARGFKDAEELKRVPAYDPLREREDFQKLLKDLEGKAQRAIG